MFNYLFGTKQNLPQEATSNAQLSGLTGHCQNMRAIKNQKSEKKEKNVVSPKSSFKNCKVEQLKNLDPGLAKAISFKNKLNSKLNLETLDPNNMKPLGNENERLAACKVCARHFSPQRIGTHQSICERMARRDTQGALKTKQLISQPASSTTKGAKAKQKLLVRPHSPTPSSSVRNQYRKATPPNKITPKGAKPRPLTAKPRPLTAKHDFILENVNCQQSNEQASSSKKKRPLSAFPFLLPKLFSKPKVEVDERVACPTCQRKFNKNSAAHHIPWCEEQASLIRPDKPPPRRKYVVPKLRKFATDTIATPQKLKKESSIASTSPAIPIYQEINKSQRPRSKADPASTESPVSHTWTNSRRQLPEAELKPKGPQRSSTQAKDRIETQSGHTSNKRQLPAYVKLKPNEPRRSSTQPKDRSEAQSGHTSNKRQLPDAEINPKGPRRSSIQAKCLPETQSRDTSYMRQSPDAELKDCQRSATHPKGLPETQSRGTSNKRQSPVAELKPIEPGRSGTHAKIIPVKQLMNTSKRRPLPVAELKPTGPDRCRTPAMDFPQPQTRKTSIRCQSPVTESKVAESGRTCTVGHLQMQKRYTSSYSNSSNSQNVPASSFSTVQR